MQGKYGSGNLSRRETEIAPRSLALWPLAASWLLLLLECAGLYKLNPGLEIYVIPYSVNVGNQKRSQ